ncbi:hypothetical protein LTR27_001621 [Elasticomyces elasticus]|nr:hypothetical protein LTR27_001621 [Elasticomyces elasticus]
MAPLTTKQVLRAVKNRDRSKVPTLTPVDRENGGLPLIYVGEGEVQGVKRKCYLHPYPRNDSAHIRAIYYVEEGGHKKEKQWPGNYHGSIEWENEDLSFNIHFNGPDATTMFKDEFQKRAKIDSHKLWMVMVWEKATGKTAPTKKSDKPPKANGAVPKAKTGTKKKSAAPKNKGKGNKSAATAEDTDATESEVDTEDMEMEKGPMRDDMRMTKSGCSQSAINNWLQFEKGEYDECLTEDHEIEVVREAYYLVHERKAPDAELLRAAYRECQEKGLKSVTGTGIWLAYPFRGTPYMHLKKYSTKVFDKVPKGSVSAPDTIMQDAGTEVIGKRPNIYEENSDGSKRMKYIHNNVLRDIVEAHQSLLC